ncbi:MAG: hypothetical protein BWY11_00889 [Firmicutes bacterium ADurb.Bin182]|nr:MAG: hypothetical protein BWY11_00889 [Firmicutes bacterium ADurb.Bin182]
MGSIEIDIGRSVYELCGEYPEIKEAMRQSGFTDIVKPGMLETAGRFMTIRKGAAMKKIDMENIKKVFSEYGFTIKEEIK